MAVPSEYKKGCTDFLGCRIDLRYRPLIPRVETAEWVKAALLEIDKLTYVRRSVNILDMFAGSGCVGVAVLKHVPESTMDFVDISPKCLKQIEINCQLNKIAKERYRLIRADVFGNCLREVGSTPKLAARYGVSPTSRYASFCRAQYDFMLANPPYCQRQNVDHSVLKYEPHQAVLGGGKDGLRVIKKFLREASKYLKPGGVIYLEFDDFQKEALNKLLQRSKFKEWEFRKDQFGSWRCLKLEAR
jgi:release factor glutamine methyltransferase